MSTVTQRLRTEFVCYEERQLGDLLRKSGLEDPSHYVVVVDGQSTRDMKQVVQEGSKVVAVPVVIGG